MSKKILICIVLLVVFFIARKSFAKSVVLGKDVEVKNMNKVKLNAKIITSKGDINLKLFPNIAPVTVLNFAHLAMRGYFAV